MNLLYTSRAKNDLDIAFEWYDRQRRGLGLGFDFLDCVEVSVKLILESPKMYRYVYSHYRACIIRRFPFSIFYTIEKENIIIHSVFDNRQNPNKLP